MSKSHSLVAFIATLATLLMVLISTFVATYLVPDLVGKLEAFGLGTITGSLVTLASAFRPRHLQADNKPEDGA